MVFLTLDFLADVLDGFADLAAYASDVRSRLSFSFFVEATVSRTFVVGQIADGLLHFALDRMTFALQFVSVHMELLMDPRARAVPSRDVVHQLHGSRLRCGIENVSPNDAQLRANIGLRLLNVFLSSC